MGNSLKRSSCGPETVEWDVLYMELESVEMDGSIITLEAIVDVLAVPEVDECGMHGAAQPEPMISSMIGPQSGRLRVILVSSDKSSISE